MKNIRLYSTCQVYENFYIIDCNKHKGYPGVEDLTSALRVESLKYFEGQLLWF